MKAHPEIKILNSIQKLTATQWDHLVPADFPFARHAFLLALENGHCLGSRTGWSPFYFTAWNESELKAALPVFAKANSYGEYIFDFNWAQAHENWQIPYYPKLVSAIPFTPATGPKILLSPDLAASERTAFAQDLLAAVQKLSEQIQSSSIHALFVTPSEIAYFESAGYFIRHSFQFHWRNRNFTDFDSFLATLRSKRRREIRRERDQVAQSRVQIQRLSSEDLRPEHAEIMYRFYSDTIQKMGGFPYLTLSFFQAVFTTMKDQICFVLATNADHEPVAGALNFFSGSTLFGRYWGCLEDYKALHFELCYYQGIEFALERKLQLFEAGAQGEHKFSRGFLPSLTYSAHQITHAALGSAIEQFVEHEKVDLLRLFADYQAHSPFSQTQSE